MDVSGPGARLGFPPRLLNESTRIDTVKLSTRMPLQSLRILSPAAADFPSTHEVSMLNFL
ncbi:uncharacterized protein J3R85_006640 [Psidium guajava]|nr:uncharacterized protein J3R85_006640 [Psidium guajava]